MRIAIDGACLANRRGFGRFAREIVGGLARAGSRHHFSIIIDRPSLETVTIPDGFATVPVMVNEAPSIAASASGRRSLGDMVAVSRAIARAGVDLIYFPASYSFVPVWGVKRVVVTLHDTLALAHPELVFPNGKGRLAWKAKEHAAVAWSDRIVTVSETSKRDLERWFRLPKGRVNVVTEGPDTVFRSRHDPSVLAKYGVDANRRFWLVVGGLSPHKNLIRLFEAIARLGEDERLVVVGAFGDVFHTHIPELRATVERLSLVERVNFTGFVPDEDLACLYTHAYALVQPSLMEGFGLPTVEAMSCGTPVASSTAGSLPEVVGDAGVFFDPTDVTAIAATLSLLRDNPELRDHLAEVALSRSALFTWDAAARMLLDVFDDLDSKQARDVTRKLA